MKLIKKLLHTLKGCQNLTVYATVLHKLMEDKQVRR